MFRSNILGECILELTNDRARRQPIAAQDSHHRIYISLIDQLAPVWNEFLSHPVP
jgi:hypothetical protein